MFIVFAGRENFQIVFNVMLTKVYGMTILTQQPSCFVLAKIPVNKLLDGCGKVHTLHNELNLRTKCLRSCRMKSTFFLFAARSTWDTLQIIHFPRFSS